MHRLTFYPLGNADTCLVETSAGAVLLFDYAAMADPDDPSDRRIDLPRAIRERLDVLGRDHVDVLALTHLDQDHIQGVSDFFVLEHASKYQGRGRVKISNLWVPAAAITESKETLTDDGRAVQAEARYRLQRGEGVRVFSRPAALKEWLAEHGLTIESRAHLITDAGQLVPSFKKDADCVEFFAHSPFADREDGKLVDRNSGSLVLQATFTAAGRDSRLMLGGDVSYEIWTRIVTVTKAHANDHRLEWDVFKLPHHCSYLSLGPEKGRQVTKPVPEAVWLFEHQGAVRSIAVATSDPIPARDTDQPPHRQAAAYYRGVSVGHRGKFFVTMEHPTQHSPKPLVVVVDRLGARLWTGAEPGGTVVPAPTVVRPRKPYAR
ncbi:MAG: hypothetical protein F4151_05820 [Gammaproteobacteria bacterium]|nr:hypothetical protein [Gammaproteobacteria bacterium]